jgi:putative NADPH-quinone reductase
MPKHVLIIQGHPDSGRPHFCHALADAYALGAAEAGHEVQRIAVAALDFPLLRAKEEWDSGPAPAAIQPCEQALREADHIVIVYPLWLGGMPALLKGFLEQAFRPSFAAGKAPGLSTWRSLLKGKSARIVVTMGMPALVYRWYFGAHSLKSLERNILGFVGIRPIRETLIGMIESGGTAKHQKCLTRLRKLGRVAA